MRVVESINVAPVKSLGLVHPDSVHVDSGGILEDRRLYLISPSGRLLTQREVGQPVRIQAEYQNEPEELRLRFPDGTSLEGPLVPGEPVVTMMWGRFVQGHLVGPDWNTALSDFCKGSVMLVRSNQPGQCYDEYPISMISEASVQLLNQHPSASVTFDNRRFRPNFLIGGCEPHEEDTWLDGVIQIGDELRLRVVARDPRCAITTHDPDTGERDVDTLRLILSYRPSARAPYFGVYDIVERPGAVSVGDIVTIP